MPVSQRGVKPGSVKQAASIIQGYQIVPNGNSLDKGHNYAKQSSMPPSLTAINVQSMARDFNLINTAVFGTSSKPTEKKAKQFP